MTKLFIRNDKHFDSWYAANKYRPNAVDWIVFPTNMLANWSILKLKTMLPNIGWNTKFGFGCKNKFKDEGNKKAELTCFEFWKLVRSYGFYDDFDMDEWVHPYNNYQYNLDFNPLRESDYTNLLMYREALGTGYTMLSSLLAPLKSNKTTGFTYDESKIHMFEIMAGTAEMSWWGHWQHLPMSFTLIDLDIRARDFTAGMPWYSCYNYNVGDVLEARSWHSKLSQGKLKLGYVGKNSYCMLVGKLNEFLKQCLDNTDILYLETCIPYALRKGEGEMIEMAKVGMVKGGYSLRYNYYDEDELTGRMKFDLKLRKGKTTTIVGSYDWTSIQPNEVYNAAKYINPNIEMKWLNLSNNRLYETRSFGPRSRDENDVLCLVLYDKTKLSKHGLVL